jgi:hypothetical protein
MNEPDEQIGEWSIADGLADEGCRGHTTQETDR